MKLLCNKMLKKLLTIFSIICIFYIFTSHHNLFSKATVTYKFNDGRFGDNLLIYLHAKWLSFTYNIPLLYKPFQYSDQLVLHFHENQHTTRAKQTITLSKNNMNINVNENILYIVPYFSEVLSEYKHPLNKHWIYYKIDWDNELFYKEICKMIQPINKELLNISLPLNKISLAVHIRKGGGYDNPEAPKKDPLKFPPESYYIEQIKNISEHLHNADIYAFIFTDDQNPNKIVERFKNELKNYHNITFDYRENGNRHNANVLEDFFAITKFDCLIRSQSNFSIVAAKLGRPKIEIAPIDYYIEEDNILINKVEIITRNTT